MKVDDSAGLLMAICKISLIMCMMLYAASAKPLPLVAWDENNPNFYVEELEKSSESVSKQFSMPYVYYLGSHQGCGCGFSYGRYDYDTEEENAARESVRRLSDFLVQSIDVAGPVELYSCWDGDEEDEATQRIVMTPKEIGGEAFWFQERQFIQIIG